jgi:hypothetical protein
VLRFLAIVLGALFIGGCAGHPSPVEDSSPSDPVGLARPAAAALVFDPPASEGLPEDALAREDRQPQAFVGYQEEIAEFFYLRWDDRQSNWGHGHHGDGGGDDHFERRAVSERVGVMFR